MMKNISSMGRLVGVGAIAMIVAAGCGGGDANNETAKDVAGPVDQAVNSAGRALDGATDAAGNTLAGAGNAAENAAAGAGNAVAGAGNAVAGAAGNLADAATTTPAVKNAIINSAALKGVGGNINVDTANDSVTLSGTVKNQVQKGAAAAIAKKNAPGYKIVNNLKVSQ